MVPSPLLGTIKLHFAALSDLNFRLHSVSEKRAIPAFGLRSLASMGKIPPRFLNHTHAVLGGWCHGQRMLIFDSGLVFIVRAIARQPDLLTKYKRTSRLLTPSLQILTGCGHSPWPEKHPYRQPRTCWPRMLSSNCRYSRLFSIINARIIQSIVQQDFYAMYFWIHSS